MTLTIEAPSTSRNGSLVGRFGSFRRSLTGRRHLDAPANMLLLGVLWFAYAAVRNLAGDTEQAALGNASRLLEVEATIGIDVERAFQSVIDWPQVFTAANTYYLLHFPLTLTVIVLAFWRSRTTVFPVVRNSLIGCTAVALVIHWLIPMAPPRMLPGFVDAGAAYGPDPYAIAGSENANQFAAMPSMHVAWAILAGYAIVHLSGGRLARVAGVVHPVLTGIVVIVTGHHFVSDVAIGAGLAIGFLLLTTRSARWSRVVEVADWSPPSRTALDRVCRSDIVGARAPSSTAVRCTHHTQERNDRRSEKRAIGGRRERLGPPQWNRSDNHPNTTKEEQS